MKDFSLLDGNAAALSIHNLKSILSNKSIGDKLKLWKIGFLFNTFGTIKLRN
jgi:hypothetical protein